eukprot:5000398-Pleurochrysis_carterae.AAC.1
MEGALFEWLQYPCSSCARGELHGMRRASPLQCVAALGLTATRAAPGIHILGGQNGAKCMDLVPARASACSVAGRQSSNALKPLARQAVE